MSNRAKPVKRKPMQKRRARRFHWSVLAIPAAVVAVLVIASFSVAASQEEHNSFCASCHTQPETVYYQRDQQSASAPVDLSSFHSTKSVKCIDCHSGSGVFGRVGAIMEGSMNAAAFYTRTAKQPSTMNRTMPDDNCVKCHVDVYTDANFNNHFHRFLPRWQAADASAASCVTCHAAHTTDGSAQIGYLSQTKTEVVCQACHTALGAGG